MDRKVDVYKAAGVIIRDRKLLLCREFDEDIFIAPGGRLDAGETPLQTVKRELKEELGVDIAEENLEEFGTFYAEAATMKGSWLQMDVFLVNDASVDPQPMEEIEELKWLTSSVQADIKVGSIFEHEVIPRLKAKDLID